MKSPLFLFSLPRSGSTLLQKILMGHPQIASVAEPWLMLPFVYAYKKEGLLAEYSHMHCHLAFEDLINNLPNKKEDYNRYLRDFAFKVYSSLCDSNEVYFLDKTPRYYLIIPEIASIFPDAKFVFLFRNPVHVYSSILVTWGNNRFKRLYNNHIDLAEGPNLLSQGYSLIKDKAFAIRYESFVTDPASYLKGLFEYLELEYDERTLKGFVDQDTKGRLGDPTGVKAYKKIETVSLKKWKNTFSTPLRKKILKCYVNHINEKILNLQGYSKNQIMDEIDQMPVANRKLFQDCFDYAYSFIVRVFKLRLFFTKDLKRWALKKNLQ